MAHVKQGIFHKNLKRYTEFYNEYYSISKNFKRAKKEKNYEISECIFDTAKQYKDSLRSFRYEFKGFLDSVECKQKEKQDEYNMMYKNTIGLLIDTKKLIKNINNFNNTKPLKSKSGLIKIVSKV